MELEPAEWAGVVNREVQEARQLLPLSGAQNADPFVPFLPAQILCCVCAIPIAPNAVNMCAQCLQTRYDIGEGIAKQVQQNTCRGCGRYERRDGSFAPVEPESAELMRCCSRSRAGWGRCAWWTRASCGPSPTPAASRSKRACRRRSSRVR